MQSLIRYCHPLVIADCLKDHDDLEGELHHSVRFLIRAITPEAEPVPCPSPSSHALKLTKNEFRQRSLVIRRATMPPLIADVSRELRAVPHGHLSPLAGRGRLLSEAKKSGEGAFSKRSDSRQTPPHPDRFAIRPLPASGER